MLKIGDEVTLVTEDLLNGLSGTVEEVYPDARACRVFLHKSRLTSIFYKTELRKVEK